MAELQRFIWMWPSILDQLRALNVRMADEIERSTRPLAAERRPDGRLLLVLGCWVAADRASLEASDSLDLLARALKRMLEEQIEVQVVHWPAGDGAPDQPPDPLAGLSPDLREQGMRCGGALHRSFFAAMAERGLIPECQYPVLNYRLDFAMPHNHVGVQIGGWNWRAWTRDGAVGRREREQSLGAEGWTVLWFTGEEILDDLDQVVDNVMRQLTRRSGWR